MARIVDRNAQEPYKPSIGGEDKYLSRCGLSKNQPFCDGSHKLTQGEDKDKDKLYWYDEDGKRNEHPDSFPGIRTY